MAISCATYRHCVTFLFIVGTLLSISSAFQTCNGLWNKVYENDPQGQGITGNRTDLFESQQRGATIRYMVSGLGYVEELDNVLLYKDKLCGQSLLHVTKDRWDHFLDDVQWKFVIVCTDGSYTTYKRNLGSSESISETVSKEGITWFVKESTWQTPVYSLFDGGTSVSGNKDDLKNSVISGYDVKFHFKDYLYLLHSHNIEISENTHEVAAQNIWSFNIRNDGPLEWGFKMVISDGFTDGIFWKVGEHVKTQHNNIIAATDWFVEPCWRLAFSNDENGVQKEGSLSNLIAAVELGQRVKVVMGTYSTELDNVRSDWGRVSGQILSQVSKNDSHTFLDDTFWIWQLVDTSGTVRTRRYSIGDNTNRGDTVEKKPISWFVDTRPWKKVLSTDKNGVVTFGSKAALKNAVENGASVRVGLQFGQAKRMSSPRGVAGRQRGGLSRFKERKARLEGMLGQNNAIGLLQEIVAPSKDKKNGETLDSIKERKERVTAQNERKDPVLASIRKQKDSVMLDGSKDRKDGLERMLVRGKDRQDRTQRRFGAPKERNYYLRAMLRRHKERKGRFVRSLFRRTGIYTRLGAMMRRFKESYGTEGYGGKRDGESFVWDADSKGWFVMKAENLEFGPSEELAAELIKSVSTEAVWPKEFQIKDDPFWRFMIVTTQGKVDIAQWRVGANIDDGRFSEKANVNWFVNF